MNQPTALQAAARRNVALFLRGGLDGFEGTSKFSVSSSVDGSEDPEVTVQYTDVPVFRSGTFRDSLGIQHTWDPFHLDQIVANYELLKGRGIFADVPVRKGHGSFFGDPIETLAGYHTNLRTEERVNPIDGKTYTYLLASYEVTDGHVQEALKNKHYRNRSAEIGSYVTNDEAEFWPVYLGFAFVDIPAVEGLNQYAANRGLGSTFSIMDPEKEAPVGTTPVTPTSPAPVVAAAATVPAADAPAQPAVAVHAAPVAQPTAPIAQPVPTVAPVAPAVFSIGGVQTSDVAAVQRHIETLETQAREQVLLGRDRFVDELAMGPRPRILAAQIETTKAFARTLDETQWTAWQATMTSAPALSALSIHGQGVGTTPPVASIDGESDSQVEILRGIVNHHKATGMSDAQIASTQSYQKLQALLQSARTK